VFLLLFLHADSRLRDARLLGRAVAALEVEQAATPEAYVAGHFGLVFSRTSRRHGLAYAFLEAKSRTERPYTTNGDQGLLLSRALFVRLGGFDTTFPFFEDQVMAERIRGLGRLITLPGSLETSARRFETEGFGTRYLLMAVIAAAYWSGVHAFLHEAPKLYPAQHEAGPLRLSPYLALLRRILARDLDVRGRCHAWRRAGRFLCQNAWQPFLFLDILGRPLWGGKRPFLGLYDRLFAPILKRGLLDLPAALLCRLLFFGILPPLLTLAEEHFPAARRNSATGQGIASGRPAP